MALLHESLMVVMLVRQAGAHLLHDGALVTLVHAPRHPLRVVHADPHRAVGAVVDQSRAHRGLL
jgi:hypothetical protein